MDFIMESHSKSLSCSQVFQIRASNSHNFLASLLIHMPDGLFSSTGSTRVPPPRVLPSFCFDCSSYAVVGWRWREVYDGWYQQVGGCDVCLRLHTLSRLRQRKPDDGDLQSILVSGLSALVAQALGHAEEVGATDVLPSPVAQIVRTPSDS